jgi:UDP-N-acetyl-D-galactosamine dehydrogenase
MGIHVAHQVMRLMANRRLHVVDARILVLGLTFKEDCSDLRNTRVVDIVRELEAANASVDVWDPLVDAAQAGAALGVNAINAPTAGSYDAIVLAVAHSAVRSLGSQAIRAFGKPGAVLFDVKSVLALEQVDARL